MARIVCDSRFDRMRRKAVNVRDVVSDVLPNSTVNRRSLRGVATIRIGGSARPATYVRYRT